MNSKCNLTRNLFKKILIFLLVILNFRFVGANEYLPATIIGMFKSDRDLLIKTNNDRFFIVVLNKPYDFINHRTCTICINDDHTSFVQFENDLYLNAIEKSYQELSEELKIPNSVNSTSCTFLSEISTIYPIEDGFVPKEIDHKTRKSEKDYKPQKVKSTKINHISKTPFTPAKSNIKSVLYRLNLKILFYKMRKYIRTLSPNAITENLGMKLYHYFSSEINDPSSMPICEVELGERGDLNDIISNFSDTNYLLNQVIHTALYDEIDTLNMEEIIVNEMDEYDTIAEELFYFLNFIIRLTTPNMSERMNVQQALNHQFLNIKF